MATDVRAQMGGLQGRALKSGDTLQIANRTVAIAEPGAWYVGWPHSSKTLEIRTLPGIQEDWFAEDSVHEFGSEVFTKSGSFDRTGAKLDGPKLARKNDREMTSQPVAPGSIQVPRMEFRSSSSRKRKPSGVSADRPCNFRRSTEIGTRPTRHQHPLPHGGS